MIVFRTVNEYRNMNKIIIILLVFFPVPSQEYEDFIKTYYGQKIEEWRLKYLSRKIFSEELIAILFQHDDFKANVLELSFQVWEQTVKDMMYFDTRSFWKHLYECIWNRKNPDEIKVCMKIIHTKSRAKSYFEKQITNKVKRDGDTKVRKRIQRLNDEIIVIENAELILNIMEIEIRYQKSEIGSDSEWFQQRTAKKYYMDEMRDLVCSARLKYFYVSIKCSTSETTTGKGLTPLLSGVQMIILITLILPTILLSCITCSVCIISKRRKEDVFDVLQTAYEDSGKVISDIIYIFNFQGPFLGRIAIVIARRRCKTSNIYICTDDSTKRLVLLGYDKTMNPNRSKKHVVLGYETFLKHPFNIQSEAIRFSHGQAQLRDSYRKESIAAKGRETQLSQGYQIKDIMPMLSSSDVQFSQSVTSQSSFTLDNMKSIKQCIRRFSSWLWHSHSNLRIISADTEKIKNGKSIKKQCIVFYCLSKGYIPLGENPFPKYLPSRTEVFETDVREGYYVPGPKTKNLPTTSKMGYLDSFNEPLCMGSNIGEENKDETGTLGLFVNVSGDTKGFITCCHVLFDCTQMEKFRYLSWYNGSKYSVLQPGKSAFCGRPDKNCGEIEKAVFYPNRTPSVDAALVKITDREPTSGHFAIRNRNQVKELGYKENAYPNYVQGKVRRVIKETDLDLPVLKSGSTTGLTRSYFKLDGAEVRIFNEGNILGMKDAKPIVMKGQYEIEPGSKQNPFFIPGDSGSAVFLREPDKSLVCIGIAIGTTTYDTTIVTPIGTVLDSLGLDDKSITHFE